MPMRRLPGLGMIFRDFVREDQMSCFLVRVRHDPERWCAPLDEASSTFADQLVVVMRVYFEKPRTIGRKDLFTTKVSQDYQRLPLDCVRNSSVRSPGLAFLARVS